MCRRSSRRWTVIPSAPPRVARTAAATGSGSFARRACRTVATWSMLTPSRIMGGSVEAVAGEVVEHLAVTGHLAGHQLVQEDREDDAEQALRDRGDHPDHREPLREEEVVQHEQQPEYRDR